MKASSKDSVLSGRRSERASGGPGESSGNSPKGGLQSPFSSLMSALASATLSAVSCMGSPRRSKQEGQGSSSQTGVSSASVTLEVGAPATRQAGGGSSQDLASSKRSEGRTSARVSMQGSDKDLSGRSKDASVRRSRSNSAVSIQAAARGRAGRELRKEALSEHRSSVKAGLGDVVIDRGARAPSTAGEGGPPACLQAGGHPNTFKRDPTQRDILIKEGTSHEQSIYEQLQEESLVDFTPRYYGAMEHGALTLLRIGDETAWCAAPCVMDIKLGTRTFVESEVDNPKLRSDLADKIRYIDPAALTPEEAELGVTKLRYMQFRDATSSSASLGFRVEGIRVGADCFAECKRLRTPQQLCEALRWYVGGREALRAELQQQLHALRAALEKSEWLARHELVGSSLLFVYDAAHVAPDDPGHMPPRVRMIDFAKVVPLEPGCRLTHRAEWMQGNHEDGFLAGLDALIELWGDPLRALCSEPPPGAPDAPAPRLAPAPSEV